MTGKPCLLYATDLNKYDLKRGFYSDIHTWPYPLAENVEELIQNIKSFDPKQYAENIEKHLLDLGSFEKGNASKTITKYLLKNL